MTPTKRITTGAIHKPATVGSIPLTSCVKPHGLAASMSAALMIVAGGCTQEMFDQPRYETLESSDFFPDGKSARLKVEGTVSRGALWNDHPFFSGTSDGQPVNEIPPDPRPSRSFVLTRSVLQRGRERFDIYCSVCHGRTGYGDGMVVRRGFRKPPSLHSPRLRNDTPPGYLFDVISNGFRTMPAQGSRIPVADRWAVVAYIGVLQASQHVVLDSAPKDIRDKFEEP